MAYKLQRERLNCYKSANYVGDNGTKGKVADGREEGKILRELRDKQEDEGGAEEEKDNPDDGEDLGDDIKGDDVAGEMADWLLDNMCAV